MSGRDFERDELLRQLGEERRGREEERRGREEERRGREEERQRCKEERRRRRKERRGREEERRGREEERQRCKEERRRRKKERRRREEAERRAQEDRRGREDAEQSLLKTALVEYIRLCHDHYFLNISLQTDKTLTAKGAMTSPVSRKHPKRLAPWETFLEEQMTTFQRLYTCYPPEGGPRVFERNITVKDRGKDVKMRSLGYKSDLRHLQRDTIERPVTYILNHLGSLNAVCREFNIRGSISFKDHPQPMSERSEEVQSRISPSTPPVPRTDQVCVYIDADDHRNLAFVIEDKPPQADARPPAHGPPFDGPPQGRHRSTHGTNTR